MVTYDIEPHVGVGPIKLSMSHGEVRRLFGEPRAVIDGREFYFDGFFIDFDSAGQVEFIELAESRHFRALFRGACLHELPAEEAVQLVSRYGEYDRNDPEPGYSYIFVDLQLSLWRGTTDRRFEAVGVAVDGYFTAKKKQN